MHEQAMDRFHSILDEVGKRVAAKNENAADRYRAQWAPGWPADEGIPCPHIARRPECVWPRSPLPRHDVLDIDVLRKQASWGLKIVGQDSTGRPIYREVPSDPEF